MTVKPRPCQAQNPATCRVHGTFDPNTAILNHRVLQNNIRDNEDKKKTVTNIVELEELNEQIKLDEELYYQSLQGLEELGAQLYNRDGGLSPVDRIRLRKQLEDSYTTRRQRLEQQVNLKPVYDGYNNLLEEQSVGETFSPATARTAEEKAEILAKLQSIEPGTPLAVKTRTGAIIYDKAGDGLMEGANRKGLVNRVIKKGFLEPFHKDDFHQAAIGFAHSNTYMNIGYVQEITVLKPNVFDGGVPEQLKPTTGKEVSLYQSHPANHVYAVEGDGYYYQMNAEISTQVSKKGTKMHRTRESLASVSPTSVKKITQIV